MQVDVCCKHATAGSVFNNMATTAKLIGEWKLCNYVSLVGEELPIKYGCNTWGAGMFVMMMLWPPLEASIRSGKSVRLSCASFLDVDLAGRAKGISRFRTNF